jgi:UDP-glucose 4-epimerase
MRPTVPGVKAAAASRIASPPVRALVTGGAGFIGSNLVDALAAQGHEVTVIDDLSTGKRENLDAAVAAGAELVEADIRDGAGTRDVVARVGPEVVFHLAAQIDVRKSAADPAADARVNVEGTINVLEAARAAGVRRFVNTSTGGAVYGEGQILPAPEEHPVAPEAPYGQSKFAAEGYCELFRRLHGLSTISLRYGNVYGPRQDPLGEAGVIAIFCGRLLAGERPIVFGDGLQTRDYVHVDDVVAANLTAAGSEVAGSFNVGTGVETTVLQLVEALAPLASAPFEAEHHPPRPGEVQRIALDCTRAREELGWESRVLLEDGLTQTLESVR